MFQDAGLRTVTLKTCIARMPSLFSEAFRLRVFSPTDRSQANTRHSSALQASFFLIPRNEIELLGTCMFDNGMKESFQKLF